TSQGGERVTRSFDGAHEGAHVVGRRPPRDERRALAEAPVELHARVKDLAGPRDLGLDAAIQRVELLAVGPAFGPVAEADDVRRRRCGQLQPRRLLDARGELLCELAAPRDELGDALPALLLQRRPDARPVPAPARLDPEL